MIGIDIEVVAIVRIACGCPALESCIGVTPIGQKLAAFTRSEPLLSAFS